ncbi:MAG: tetratricopeptide repeat protein [Verrucomicrobiales bacterium]
MIKNFGKSILCFISILLGINLAAISIANADPALEKYFTANAAYNRKLYPVAATQFESFLKVYSSHPKADLALRGLALSNYALKKYDDAIPSFAKLIAKQNLDKSINREKLIILQGKCMLQTSQKDKAKELFINEIKSLINPSYKNSAIALIIDISFGKANWDDVIKWTPQIKSLNPSAEQLTRSLYQMGFAYYQKDLIPEAIDSLNLTPKENISKKWKTRVSYLLGECYSKNNQLEDAESSLMIALEGMADTEAGECHYRLGATRFLLKKYKKSLTNFEQYLGTNNKEETNNKNLKRRQASLYSGRIYYELKNYIKAENTLQKLAEGNDNIACNANFWLARVFSDGKKDFTKSSEILGKSLTKFNQSELIDDMEFEYANALISKKPADWKKASEALIKIESRGTFKQLAEVLALKTTCLHNLKDYQRSLIESEKFLAQYSKHKLTDDALFMRAENLLQLKRNTDALKAFDTYLKQNSDHNKINLAKLRTAQLYHISKQWEKAIKMANPLLEISKTNTKFSQIPFILGDSHFMIKDWEKAISNLNLFINSFIIDKAESNSEKVKATPNLDRAFVKSAIANDRSNKKDDALKIISIFVNQNPKESDQLPVALVEMGRLAFQLNKFAISRKSLQKYLDSKNLETFKKSYSTQLPQVMYYLGWVNSKEEKYEEASSCFSQVPINHPLAADAALQKGVALINSKNFSEASAHFSKMASTYKNHEKAEMITYYAGLSASKQEEWVAASNHYNKFTKKYPKSEFVPQALYEWAWAQKSLEKLKQAVSLYEEILKNHPDNPLTLKVQTELAELNLKGGDKEKVINELTTALKTAKNQKEKELITIQLANAYYLSGDFENSASTFEKVIEEAPNSKSLGQVLFKAGESRLKLKETVTARQHFENAAKISNLNSNLKETIQLRLGETQSVTAMHQESASTYRNFLKNYKESKWTRNAQFGLGFALENNGDYEEAIKEYSPLIRTENPNDDWEVRSHFQIGECYFNMQNYEKAMISFTKIEKEFTKYPAWQSKSVLEMGRVLIAQGKKEEAIIKFKNVLDTYGKEKAALVARQYIQEIRSN